MNDNFCIWLEPDWEEEDFFETQCGKAYCFDYEARNLSDSNYNYCPNCGKKIKIIEIKTCAECGDTFYDKCPDCAVNSGEDDAEFFWSGLPKD